jgi:N-carbamoyl-L-amino-acid hydrolase
VVTGLEVLRHFSGMSRQPVSLRLVAWAEEEGAWFGRSMLTSSAVCGSLDVREMDKLVDANGVRLVEVLARYGVHAATMTDASRWMKGIAAYLELHIEQGPVLEEMGLPLAAVVGTMGLARQRVRFVGQTAHAGSTPMRLRRDALVAAARLALEIREIAKRHNGVCTMGSVVTRPGIVTAVAGECDCTLDQRHLDAGELEAMLAETQAVWLRIAKEEKVKVEILPLYKTKPMLYNKNVINLCALTIEELSGKTFQMPSGPLHDAVEMARAGIPTGMMFVQSLNGLSHTREEDTREDHLRLAVRAFDSLTMKTIAWLTGE